MTINVNNKKQANKIDKKNKEIEDAVLVAQMLEHPGYKIVKRDLARMEKSFRFQDIMGVKDSALGDQKGIVLGIIEIQNYFIKIVKKSEQPRRDPLSGEPEIMSEKK